MLLGLRTAKPDIDGDKSFAENFTVFAAKSGNTAINPIISIMHVVSADAVDAASGSLKCSIASIRRDDILTAVIAFTIHRRFDPCRAACDSSGEGRLYSWRRVWA